MGHAQRIRYAFLLPSIAVALAAAGCTLLRHGGKHGIQGTYDVKTFGAKGDGKKIDTPAINRAIDAANRAGGGTVRVPAGTYLCYSIRLKSNVALYLDAGATIKAAKPPKDLSFGYDDPEPNPSDKYQDFGHTHWQNSLIWGVNVENVSILGPGRIDGDGLVRSNPTRDVKEEEVRKRIAATRAATNPSASKPAGASTNVSAEEWDALESATGAENEARAEEGRRDRPAWAPPPPATNAQTETYPNERDSVPAKHGNKAISLKLCRNVVLRDVSVKNGGHFAILATGVDNLTIDNMTIDTNRDGMDIDACRNVQVSNCRVNSPGDDGICLKSSYALGFARATENVTITNCQVSGYASGTFLDGTYKMTITRAGPNRAESNRAEPTGRIKFGTESNGGFKNVTVSNCVFDRCRGLALETVDGGLLEDVAITNITMRHVSNSPFYLRLGARLRGPAGTPVGALRRVNISNVVVHDADPRFSSIISGVPGHDVEDVKFTDIQIHYRGGGPRSRDWATTRTAEREKDYPEPRNFGENGAYGFFVRHATGIEFRNVSIDYAGEEFRPPFVLEDVRDARFSHVTAPKADGVPTFNARDVTGLRLFQFDGLPDGNRDRVGEEKF